MLWTQHQTPRQQKQQQTSKAPWLFLHPPSFLRLAHCSLLHPCHALCEDPRPSAAQATLGCIDERRMLANTDLTTYQKLQSLEVPAPLQCQGSRKNQCVFIRIAQRSPVIPTLELVKECHNWPTFNFYMNVGKARAEPRALEQMSPALSWCFTYETVTCSWYYSAHCFENNLLASTLGKVSFILVMSSWFPKGYLSLIPLHLSFSPTFRVSILEP